MSDTAAGTYEIRWAADKDWIPAMHMIWKTFLKFEAVDYTEELIYCLKAIFCTGNDITIQLAYANAFCNRFNNNTMMFNMETLKRQDSLLKAISYTLHNINDTFNTDLSLEALIYIINTPLNYDVAWEISLENLPPKLSRLKHKVKESFHSLYM